MASSPTLNQMFFLLFIVKILYSPALKTSCSALHQGKKRIFPVIFPEALGSSPPCGSHIIFWLIISQISMHPCQGKHHFPFSSFFLQILLGSSGKTSTVQVAHIHLVAAWKETVDNFCKLLITFIQPQPAYRSPSEVLHSPEERDSGQCQDQQRLCHPTVCSTLR